MLPHPIRIPVEISLKVACLPGAVGKQSSYPCCMHECLASHTCDVGVTDVGMVMMMISQIIIVERL